MPAKGRGLASLVDVPANPEKESRELERGRGREEKKKEARVGDVFRGATSDWNSVPHEPGGDKVNKKGPDLPSNEMADHRPRRTDGVQIENPGRS